MTEEEWLRASNLRTMREPLRGKTSDRKARLFICAVCRLLWSELDDERSRAAVKIGEEYADGQKSEQEPFAAWLLARDAKRALSFTNGGGILGSSESGRLGSRDEYKSQAERCSSK
jgi:hypothetical protein